MRAPSATSYPALPSFEPPVTSVASGQVQVRNVEHLKDVSVASDDTIKAQVGAVGTWVGAAPAADPGEDWRGTVRTVQSKGGRASSL